MKPRRIFSAYGVELEYMIVETSTLNVAPVADELMRLACGETVTELERGPISWNNELARHVIELKTGTPATAISRALADEFQSSVKEIFSLLQAEGKSLLPGAMHPWMDPLSETVLWHGENQEIYSAFDRIFCCSGHGWSNLQSAHVNLPFADDDEFARLHAAIRIVLPLLPALAASSPVYDGKRASALDGRLTVYKTNAARVPSVSGRVIPEPVYSEADYRSQILGRIYDDLSLLDPDQILREEWVNARGAIARFERNTIEIRVLDVQECPRADLAIIAFIVELLKAVAAEQWAPLDAQKAVDTELLAGVFDDVVNRGDEAVLDNPLYTGLFGAAAGVRCRDLLSQLFSGILRGALRDWEEELGLIFSQGPLARRIVNTLAGDYSHQALAEVYGRLRSCLAEGRLFRVG